MSSLGNNINGEIYTKTTVGIYCSSAKIDKGELVVEVIEKLRISG